VRNHDIVNEVWNLCVIMIKSMTFDVDEIMFSSLSVSTQILFDLWIMVLLICLLKHYKLLYVGTDNQFSFVYNLISYCYLYWELFIFVRWFQPKYYLYHEIHYSYTGVWLDKSFRWRALNQWLCSNIISYNQPVTYTTSQMALCVCVLSALKLTVILK